VTADDPLGDMLRQVQQMQSDVTAAQEALAAETVEGHAGGGVVKATVTGEGELQSVSIDPSAVDAADVEMLEDLVVAAVRDAQRAARDLRAERLGSAAGIDLGGLGLGDIGGLLG
jgi:DNA-binding YbaB/EbfC family protein